ncbi:hypothetical protein JZ751_025673 [Albula glossodonta]|uniref:Uncharacterized protein n=1 Tax=Albula glossodonta TaxID=121402 RepID=A0A8T2MT06_9TELE|nr:hypothetical protein JZ751_025673 [Albula glossodonta]
MSNERERERAPAPTCPTQTDTAPHLLTLLNASGDSAPNPTPGHGRSLREPKPRPQDPLQEDGAPALGVRAGSAALVPSPDPLSQTEPAPHPARAQSVRCSGVEGGPGRLSLIASQLQGWASHGAGSTTAHGVERELGSAAGLAEVSLSRLSLIYCLGARWVISRL